MPDSAQSRDPQFIAQGELAYPARLIQRLGAEAPKALAFVGVAAPIFSPMTAFLCSKEAPGATILKAFDQAAAWRDAGRCVVSGFHSPLEQQCLEILLRGHQPVVMALARGIGRLALPAAQRTALDDGRLTIVSPFPVVEKRATTELARRRNRFVAALAEEVVFAYASPAGSLSQLAEDISAWQCAFRRLHE